MGNAFIKREQTITRNAKRLFMQEVAKVKDHFHAIDDKFLAELFHLNQNPQIGDYNNSYQKLYHHYNNLWESECKRVHMVHKLKYLGVDVNWFKRNYYPSEKPYK